MLLSPVTRPANSGLEELHESPLTNQSLGTSEIQWKNPGMSTPMERDEFLIIDQARADNNIDMLLVLPETLKNARQVLDVGCGSGNSTAHIHSKSPENCHCLGVDTQENIDFALNKYLPVKHNNLSYQAVASPFDLPAAPYENGWDVISAFAFFSWIPLEAHTEVLRRMHTLMAPNGFLLARTQAEGKRPYREATDLVMTFPEWIPYFQNYTSTYEDQTKRGFKQCLKNAGFEVEICNYFEDEFLFFSRESMINYFLQWLPQLSEIKGQTLEETGLLHRKFVTQVIDIYCDDKDLCEEIKNNELIKLIFPGILATARKKIDSKAIQSQSEENFSKDELDKQIAYNRNKSHYFNPIHKII